MRKFQSPFGEVELTDERERHILQFHPEMRLYRKHLPSTIENPDTIRRSKSDQKVVILYHSILTEKKCLAVVIKMKRRNFILTAYLTNKLKTPKS